MIVMLFFLLGLVIGSFLNVVVYRLQTGESFVSGRSHCARCGKQIRWYDNIPLLGFLWLRGKCRDCRTHISWQYPLVELGTGLVFVLIGWAFFSLEDSQTWLLTAFYLALFSLLIIVFVYDWLTMYIPMVPVWMAVALVVAYDIATVIAGSASWGSLWPLVLSGAGAFLFFYALVAVSHETWMGMGDAYLTLLMGLVLGWPTVLWALTFSFGLGSVIGLALVAWGSKGMKSQIPFGPFLVIGTLATLVLPKIFPSLAVWMLW